MSLERLFAAARAHGLDVLLEHPGQRFRLAYETTRRRLRSGAKHRRSFVAIDDVTGRRVDRAADALLRDLERTPTDTGE